MRTEESNRPHDQAVLAAFIEYRFRSIVASPGESSHLPGPVWITHAQEPVATASETSNGPFDHVGFVSAIDSGLILARLVDSTQLAVGKSRSTNVKAYNVVQDVQS